MALSGLILTRYNFHHNLGAQRITLKTTENQASLSHYLYLIVYSKGALELQ